MNFTEIQILTEALIIGILSGLNYKCWVSILIVIFNGLLLAGIEYAFIS